MKFLKYFLSLVLFISVPFLVEAQPAFEVVKTSSSDPLEVGKFESYTIKITNIGDAPTSGTVNFRDVLPIGIQLTELGSKDDNWVLDLNGLIVTGTHSDPIQPGQTTTIEMGIIVQTGQSSLTNRATVSGGGAATVPVSLTTGVKPRPPFIPEYYITKTHTPDFFTTGQQAAFVITIQQPNLDATVGPIIVTDTLPEGLTFVSGVGEGWRFTANGQVVTAVTENVLGAFETAPPLVILVNVDDRAAPTVINVASATGGGVTSTAFVTDLVSIAPTSPRNFKGKVVKNKFASQSSVVNRLKWSKSASKAALGYLLFRNGVQIADFSSSGPFHYTDRSGHRSNTYTLVAIGPNGISSAPATVTLP